MAITEIGEWRLIPLIINFKSKEAISSIRESITDIGKTPGLTTEKLPEITDNDNYAVMPFKLSNKTGTDKKIVVPVLVNVTSTKNQEFFKGKAKSGLINVPSIDAGLIANWRDVFGSKAQNAFDEIEKRESRYNKKLGKQTSTHMKLELILTHYKQRGSGVEIIKSLLAANEGVTAGLKGLDVKGYSYSKDVPVYIAVVEYDAGNTRQVSIIFESDAVKQGEKLTNETVTLIVKNARSKVIPPGQQFVPPGFLKELISKAESTSYREIKRKL